MGFFSGKKLLLLGSITILLAAIPLTVYFITQQQEVRSRATPSTVLSLCDSTKTTACESNITATVGQTFNLDIMVDPGTNLVSWVTIHLTYDPTKLETTAAAGFVPTSALSVIVNPVYTSGTVTASLGVGADSTKTIQTPTKIATITFKALAPISGASNKVVFGNQTEIKSTNESQDQHGENVLSTTIPALITIAAGTTTPTPTPTGIATTPVANQPPVCTALNLDRLSAGTAPYSITFTANGNDPNGTISKVTFDFGDGPTIDVSQTGGIGTNSVSTQTAHTYNNPGTYTASATLTDNANAVSVASAACTKVITVTATQAQAPVGSGDPALPTFTPTPTLTPTPTPLPAKVFTEEPGPNNTIVGIGAISAVLTIIGGLLFLSL